MSVDEFLAWAETQSGRHELFDGEVVAMSPQRARHARTKYGVQAALARSIAERGLPCEMLPDGMTVPIDAQTAYEPDALVRCGDLIPDDATIVTHPIVVVEVLSPSTSHVDVGAKLDGYFRVPSIMHYLIVDPKRRVAIHHRRDRDQMIATRIASTGSLELNPPGLTLSISDLFACLP